MKKRSVHSATLLGICLGIVIFSGCPSGAPTSVFKLEKVIIGTWEFEQGRDVLTFYQDKTFDGKFNAVDANGTYAVRGDLLFVKFESVDLYLVYQVFGTSDDGLLTDGGRGVDTWNAVI